LDGRERFTAIMSFRRPDRFPLYEWLGYWKDTLDRWYGEGLPAGMTVEDYFDFDRIDSLPIDFGPIPRFVPKTLEGDNHEGFEDLNLDAHLPQLPRQERGEPREG